MRSFVTGCVLLTAFLAGACAHAPLAPGSLDDIKAVAIVARVQDDAGPTSTVFRDDATWNPQLAERKIDATEGDRRLANVLANGSFEKTKDGGKRLIAHTVTRFELADSLRLEVLNLLPKQQPWNNSVNPADVARALESFLVHEVPAPAPDYQRLLELGVDSVVELVIQEYGLHAANGRVGLYVVGSARLFRIKGGELYHRRFFSDELSPNIPPLEGLDPFAVAKNAELFAARLKLISGAIAMQVASDLTFADRRAPEVLPPSRAKPSASTPAPKSDDSL